jgi:hypothetical protein
MEALRLGVKVLIFVGDGAAQAGGTLAWVQSFAQRHGIHLPVLLEELSDVVLFGSGDDVADVQLALIIPVFSGDEVVQFQWFRASISRKQVPVELQPGLFGLRGRGEVDNGMAVLRLCFLDLHFDLAHELAVLRHLLLNL